MKSWRPFIPNVVPLWAEINARRAATPVVRAQNAWAAMSDMGQSRPKSDFRVTSALPPIAIKSWTSHHVGDGPVSDLVHSNKKHFIRSPHRRWPGWPAEWQTKCLRGREINNKLKLRGLQHWEVGRLFAFENAGHQSTRQDVLPRCVGCGNEIASRQNGEQRSPPVEKWVGANKQRIGSVAVEFSEHIIDT
jgi:hypothetical protein